MFIAIIGFHVKYFAFHSLIITDYMFFSTKYMESVICKIFVKNKYFQINYGRTKTRPLMNKIKNFKTKDTKKIMAKINIY